jgi:chaperonin GroES
MSKRPYGTRILVLVEKQNAEKKVGDLVVIAAASEQPHEGQVVAVGAQVDDITAGNTVTFSRYAGIEVEIAGVKHHVIEPGDVLLVEP